MFCRRSACCTEIPAESIMPPAHSAAPCAFKRAGDLHLPLFRRCPCCWSAFDISSPCRPADSHSRMPQVNTMQPRDTRSLVAAVGRRLQEHPAVFAPLLDALGAYRRAPLVPRHFDSVLRQEPPATTRCNFYRHHPFPLTGAALLPAVYRTLHLLTPPNSLVFSPHRLQVRAAQHAVRRGSRHSHHHRRRASISRCVRLLPHAACRLALTRQQMDLSGLRRRWYSKPGSFSTTAINCLAGLRRKADGSRRRRLRVRCAGRA